MEDFTEMIKEEMSLIDNTESREGQELRKELGIEKLEGKELLKYKLDFLVKHMGHSNLHCIEKSDYFQELVKNCIDMKKMQEYFDVSKITCIESDIKMKILCVLVDKENKLRTIYSVPEDGEIIKVSQEEVKKQFENGMRTLSKSKESEFKDILFGEKEQNYYHHTRLANLKTIVKNGLEPRNGKNSKAVEDKKEKVFFTEGMEGTIAMAASFKQKFEEDKKEHIELKDKTVDDFLGERVFLKFSSDGIENENKNESSFADGWTGARIEPQNIKVCILRNIKTGEVSYQRDNILKYMMKKNPIENFKNGNEERKERIKKYYDERNEELSEFNENDYVLEDLDLYRFYDQYEDKIEDKLEEEAKEYFGENFVKQYEELKKHLASKKSQLRVHGTDEECAENIMKEGLRIQSSTISYTSYPVPQYNSLLNWKHRDYKHLVLIDIPYEARKEVNFNYDENGEFIDVKKTHVESKPIFYIEQENENWKNIYKLPPEFIIGYIDVENKCFKLNPLYKEEHTYEGLYVRDSELGTQAIENTDEMTEEIDENFEEWDISLLDDEWLKELEENDKSVSSEERKEGLEHISEIKKGKEKDIEMDVLLEEDWTHGWE